jgi:hypothetical protein
LCIVYILKHFCNRKLSGWTGTDVSGDGALVDLAKHLGGWVATVGSAECSGIPFSRSLPLRVISSPPSELCCRPDLASTAYKAALIAEKPKSLYNLHKTSVFPEKTLVFLPLLVYYVKHLFFDFR